MGAGQKKNKLVVPQAFQAMDNFKYETANEVGVTNAIEGGYWGNISSRDCGAVGGHMVKKMIQAYQESAAGNTNT